MRRVAALFLVICTALSLAPLATAQQLEQDAFLPTGELRDPGLEAAAKGLGKTLRCVVCANQSIEDSDVELAVTLRRHVRNRMAAGVDAEQVREELVEVYGEYISYRPATGGLGILLWGLPWLVFFGVGGVIVISALRRGRGGADD